MAGFNEFKGEDEKYTLEDLYKIVQCLRAPGGCPWDREQTHYSLIKPMIEEAYEAVDAIKNDNRDNMVEELGDVLLQVVFHSIIGEEEGRFTFEDLTDGCSRKMISRHTHVFGNAVANDAEKALENWENVKKKEHGSQTLPEALNDIPHSFPALLRATKVAKKIRQFEGETPEIDENTLDDDKKELFNAGKELYETVRSLEARGINGEEALAFYADLITEEAGKE